MNFNIILGNPPYQDSTNKAKNNKLWHKFVDMMLNINTNFKILNDDGMIAMVTPASIFNSSVGFGKKFNKNHLENYSLIAANLHTSKQYFDASVDTCHWVLKQTPNAVNHLVNIPSIRDQIVDDILTKIDIHTTVMLKLVHENQHITKSDFGEGTTEIYYSGKNKTTVATNVDNNGRLKIVFPFSAAYASQFITTGSTAHFNRVLYVKNQTEADNILSYTKSNLYQFYADHYLKTSGFTPAVKNSRLPELDSTKMWTDAKVYDHFGLTQQEIDYVEEYMK